MATKRTDELKRGTASYFAPGDTGAAAAAEQPEYPKGGAVSLHRRAGLPDVLIAMSQDGQAWEVPDRAGGWDARKEVKAPGSARGLTRLAPADERRALARIGADLGQAGPAAPATSAEPKPKRKAVGKAEPSTSTKTTAAAAGSTRKAEGLTAQVVAYLTPAEMAALVGKAAADRRSVSFVTRDAIRAYLGLD